MGEEFKKLRCKILNTPSPNTTEEKHIIKQWIDKKLDKIFLEYIKSAT